MGKTNTGQPASSPNSITAFQKASRFCLTFSLQLPADLLAADLVTTAFINVLDGASWQQLESITLP